MVEGTPKYARVNEAIVDFLDHIDSRFLAGDIFKLLGKLDYADLSYHLRQQVCNVT